MWVILRDRFSWVDAWASGEYVKVVLQSGDRALLLPVILDDALAPRVQVQHLRVEIIVSNPDVSFIELVLNFDASRLGDLKYVCTLNLVLILLVFIHVLQEGHQVRI